MSVLRPQFPDHSSPFSRDQERERKRAAIISSASARFNKHGFAHTRLEDVAADLGLTKTSISYYFSSKEELAEAVYRAAVDFLADAVEQAFCSPGGPAHKITALISIYGRQLVDAENGKRPHVAAMRDLDALPDAVRNHITGRISHCITRIDDQLRAWILDTGAKPTRSEPVTLMVLALLDWMGERQTRRTDDMLAEHEILIDLITNGLAAQPGFSSTSVPLHLANNEALAIFDRDTRNKMKREAFLKAGSRLFNQKGFGGVSLGEVAASLGVSRGAFYYHIEDKEQFLDQCLERSLEIVERALQQGEDAELPPLDRVHSVLAELIYRQAAGVEPLLRPTMAAVLPAARQRRHRTRLQNIARQIGDTLTEGTECAQVRAIDTSVVEEILASVVFMNGGYSLSAGHSFAHWGIAEDPQTMTGDYLYLLFHGLRGPQ